MCVYCDKNPAIFSISESDNRSHVASVNLCIKSGTLQLEVNVSELYDDDELDKKLIHHKDSFNIKYCPFCGKELTRYEKHTIIVHTTDELISKYISTLTKSELFEFELQRQARCDTSSDDYYARLKWFKLLYKEINKVTEHYDHLGLHRELKNINKWSYEELIRDIKSFENDRKLVMLFEFRSYYGGYAVDEVDSLIDKLKLNKHKSIKIDFGSNIEEISKFLNN